MTVVMTPKEPVWNWTLKPGGRLEIYRGVPYNGYDGGGNCATLTLSEATKIAIQLDLDSLAFFDVSPGFWIQISPGESFFLNGSTPVEVYTIPAGTSNVSFDVTIFAKSDITEPKSGTALINVRIGSATGEIVGTFKINYTITPEGVVTGTLEVHAYQG